MANQIAKQFILYFLKSAIKAVTSGLLAEQVRDLCNIVIKAEGSKNQEERKENLTSALNAAELIRKKNSDVKIEEVRKLIQKM